MIKNVFCLYLIINLSIISFSCTSIEEKDLKQIETSPSEVELDQSISVLPSLNSVINKISPSVVAINISTLERDFFLRQRTQNADGSGVIITEDGFIVTNNHVVSNANTISVTLHDGNIYEASILGKFPNSDIALLKIPSNNLTPLPFSKDDSLRTGDWVIALGNAFGLEGGPTVTLGIVSALNRSIKTEDGMILTDMIQTDAAINQGNSGGPLVNLQGELVGLNTILLSRAEGIGFAISSYLVKRYTEDLMEFGEVIIPWLGMELATLTQAQAKTYCNWGYKTCEYQSIDGILIMEVEENSPSYQAGFRGGDLLTHVESEKVKSSREFYSRLWSYKLGNTINLKGKRLSKDISFDILLEKKND